MNLILLAFHNFAFSKKKDKSYQIWFVAGLNSFPNPLSSEEESNYIEQFKKGCESARNVLIEHNLRLVAHIVKKYSISGNECDDLISIGTIGLIKAITSFDTTKGTRLATYAARCIENAIPSLRKHSGTPTTTHYLKTHLILQQLEEE